MENFTNEEKNYYGLVKRMLKDDGIIDENERNFLNTKKEEYGISDERALEIENLLIENTKVIKINNSVFKNKRFSNKENSIKEYEDDNTEKVYRKIKKQKMINSVSGVQFHEKVLYYAGLPKPIHVNIFVIGSIIFLGLYLFVRLRGVTTNTAGMPAIISNAFNFAIGLVRGLSNLLTLGISEQAITIITTITMLILLIVLLIVLYLIYSFVPAFISVIGIKSDKDIRKMSNFLSCLLSIFVIVFMIGYIETANIDDFFKIRNYKKEIKTLVKNKDYSHAYDKIGNVNSIGLNYIDDKKIDNIKNREYKILIDDITNEFVKINKLEMNKENYDYVNNNIISIFDRTLNSLYTFQFEEPVKLIDKALAKIRGGVSTFRDEGAIHYENVIDEFKNNIDIKRHLYLETLIKNIENMPKEEARLKIEEIYHYSTDKNKQLVGNKTFKNHWDSKKAELMNSKGLNRKAIEYDNSKETIEILINEFRERNKLTMDRENYNYIYQEIISKYKEAIKDLKGDDKKYYNEQYENCNKELDEERHKYLEILIKEEIPKIENKYDKLYKLEEIYHNSNEEFDRKKFIGWMPIFGKLTYKQYWEKVKNDYLKELNKK